jgi:hypothetical protein
VEMKLSGQSIYLWLSYQCPNQINWFHKTWWAIVQEVSKKCMKFPENMLFFFFSLLRLLAPVCKRRFSTTQKVADKFIFKQHNYAHYQRISRETAYGISTKVSLWPVWLKVRPANTCYVLIPRQEFSQNLNKGFCYAWNCSLMAL